MFRQIMSFIGFMVCFSFAYKTLGFVISEIPAVKEYQANRRAAAQVEYEESEKKRKIASIGKFALEPHYTRMGSIIRAYRNVSFPVMAPTLASSMAPNIGIDVAYDTLSDCQFAAKVYSKILPTPPHCEVIRE